MAEDLKVLNDKLNSILDALAELQKSQKETAEGLAMLTEEMIKLQKIVEQLVK